MTSKTADNPYLKPHRLADVIAAITAMANYRYYKLDFAACAERIENDETQAEKWKGIFEDHPEFFRLSEDKASLVWRRQFLKRYDTKTGLELSRDDYERLSTSAKTKISRRPLNSNELATLVEAAINLHQRALEQKVASRYWIPILVASLAFVGALLGTLIGK